MAPREGLHGGADRPAPWAVGRPGGAPRAEGGVGDASRGWPAVGAVVGAAEDAGSLPADGGVSPVRTGGGEALRALGGAARHGDGGRRRVAPLVETLVAALVGSEGALPRRRHPGGRSGAASSPRLGAEEAVGSVVAANVLAEARRDAVADVAEEATARGLLAGAAVAPGAGPPSEGAY